MLDAEFANCQGVKSAKFSLPSSSAYRMFWSFWSKNTFVLAMRNQSIPCSGSVQHAQERSKTEERLVFFSLWSTHGIIMITALHGSQTREGVQLCFDWFKCLPPNIMLLFVSVKQHQIECHPFFHHKKKTIQFYMCAPKLNIQSLTDQQNAPELLG